MKKLEFGLRRVENILRQGKKAGYQLFFLFPTMFLKAVCFRVVKSQDCVVELTTIPVFQCDQTHLILNNLENIVEQGEIIFFFPTTLDLHAKKNYW